MSRAFSEEQKSDLKERLLQHGYELFVKQGLKKTSLEELTQPIAIAKSSFYLFFRSKEDLYLELLMRERARIEDRVMAATFLSTGDTCESLVRFIRAVLLEIENNKLTCRLLSDPEEHALLSRYGSTASWKINSQDAVQKVLPYIKQGQARGEIIDRDPAMLIRVLLTVPLVALHKEAIGEDDFQDVIELLIHVLARGITNTGKDGIGKRSPKGTPRRIRAVTGGQAKSGGTKDSLGP
jgi:AcrR family transcriptional regulator